jgi:uncharacterized protein YjbI with pentapeptide repeats
VTFRVGEFEKTLVVFAERHWKAGLLHPSIVLGEPFTRLEIGYESAYGGEGYARNPLGIGKRKVEGDGKRIRPLPRIEDPGNLLLSPRDVREPASFGPIPCTWPQRAGKLGTYKGKWLRDRWPWFPVDFDETYFNSAPEDQQLPGHLVGDEELSFGNLHPRHPDYRTRLPGLRPRCFLEERSGEPEAGGEARLREVPVRLDTLWVDMDAEQAVLVWRGVTDVRDEDHEEILSFFVTSESCGEPPRTVKSCEEEFLRLTSPGIEVVEEEPPEEPPEVDPELEEARESIRQATLEMGLDPDNPPEPTPEQIEEEEQALRDLGVERPPPPPALTREAVCERVLREESLEGEDLSGLDLSGAELGGAMLQSAILTDCNLGGTNLKGADLTRATLLRADLSEAVLSGARLEWADLTEARLIRADLSEADLTYATLASADLTEAVLTSAQAPDAYAFKATMTAVQAEGASFVGANLSGATLDGASLSRSSLREASVEGARGRKADLRNCDLHELRASEACDFREARFRGSTGRESNWEGADLGGADLSLTVMPGADFTSARLTGANLRSADLRFARLVKCDLRGANLVGINLFEGSLEKSDLTEADLRKASLYGAETQDAVFEAARREGVNVAMTKLEKGW